MIKEIKGKRWYCCPHCHKPLFPLQEDTHIEHMPFRCKACKHDIEVNVPKERRISWNSCAGNEERIEYKNAEIDIDGETFSGDVVEYCTFNYGVCGRRVEKSEYVCKILVKDQKYHKPKVGEFQFYKTIKVLGIPLEVYYADYNTFIEVDGRKKSLYDLSKEKGDTWRSV